MRHSHINVELNNRMKSLEEMCSTLKAWCDEVDKECKELRESLQLMKLEVDETTADLNELKERNRILEAEKNEVIVLTNHKRKLFDKVENMRNPKEIKIDDDKIIEEVIQIKNCVFKERMTKKAIEDCNLKIDNLRSYVKNNDILINLEK